MKGDHAAGPLHETECMDCGKRCYAIPAYIDSQRCEDCVIRLHGVLWPMDRIQGMRPRPRFLRQGPGAAGDIRRRVSSRD